MTFKEVICWLLLKSVEDKIVFTEIFLSEMTVMNRSLWSDSDISDKYKVESLKWSNELAHRIWFRLFDLKRGVNESYENDLVENIKFCNKQSQELKRYLPSMITTTVSRFNYIERKRENDERE